jgi:hypothetical protein
MKVTELEEGMLVDLESCPYLYNHPSAGFEYAEIESVIRETSDCVVVSYLGIDSVGYPTGTVLEVKND